MVETKTYQTKEELEISDRGIAINIEELGIKSEDTIDACCF